MLRELLKRFRNPDFLLLIGVLLAILGAKFYLVQHYGSDLPFWDQWDAEGDHLYLSDARGTLSLNDFLAPHNEHRIVFTKLLAYGLEKVNGQWDARLEMTVNALLGVGAIGLLLVGLLPSLNRTTWRKALIFALLLFALPLAWENTLGGFQSQFYFLLLFSIAHLAGTFGATPRRWTFWLGQLAGLCAVFSMGSGFFSALAASVLILINVIQVRRLSATHVGLLIFNGALVLLGFLLRTEVPDHATLKAHGVAQFLGGLGLVIAWPSPVILTAALTLLPILAVTYQWIRGTSSRPQNLFVLALVVWWALQVLALVLARAGNGTLLSSRYFDLLSVGVLLAAILWEECKRLFTPLSHSPAFRFLHLAWIALILTGIAWQYRNAVDNFLIPLPDLTQHRVDNVRDYVENRSDRFLDAQPFTELPYPNAERLSDWLREPGILNVLPVSVRPELIVSADPSVTAGFEPAKPERFSSPPIGYRLWTSTFRNLKSSAAFQSDWLVRPRFGFLRIFIHGRGNDPTNGLWLETTEGRTRVLFPPEAERRWTSLVMKAPSAAFRMIGSSAPGVALSFSNPVEMAFGSWFSRQVLKAGTSLFLLGAFCTTAGGGVLAARCFKKHRDPSSLHLFPAARSHVFIALAALAAILLIAAPSIFHAAFWAEKINFILGRFDRHPWAFRGPCLAAPLLLCSYSIWRLRNSTPASADSVKRLWWIGPSAFVVILIGRWPYLIMNTFFNPDESQQLAGAITLLHHPIFWRDLDGHTAGPLDFYFMSAFGLAGLPINYLVGRLATIALNTVTVCFVYKIFRLYASSARACLLTVPLLCFYSWMNEIDDLMLSTEQVPACLLIASLYCFLKWVQGSRLSPALLLTSGVLAGLTPWAKLQTAPAALAFAFGVAVFVLCQPSSRAQKRCALGWLVAGFTVPSGLIFAALLAGGLLPTFYESYIRANISYTENGTSWSTVIQTLWKQTDVFHGFIIPTAIWAAVAAGALIVRRQRPSSLYIAALIAGAVSLFTCLSPGRPFTHYTVFLIAPSGLLLGASFLEFVRAQPAAPSFGRLGASLFALSIVGPLLIFRLEWKFLPLGRMQAYWGLSDSAPAKILRPVLKSDDTLAVWGWYPDLFVQLQISQGVRDAHTERAIVPSNFQTYYETRYLADLQNNRPTAFVDATGPLSIFFKDPESTGLPAFPDIRAYIESHYTLISNQPEARVFLRNDRI